ncbi:MAG: hypothetical protein COU29_01405 [Candidatus Magasanikbacteria bacterium CG10_big_fil_rev_8_21_14_0_10_36_32]|uniref:DUF5673 domain-containing protein n=1 Tax=Candidatus Magasanikbacteria bacterium CG10_big_fil_rev_8_21_14_0_10_36_32 TaxID=1974646 RepID=A0A2M6W6Q5_9BACT|nr:MAG: hypothetical protein COU29_01405 [Candidatus Magasanikbacteria bacterium CG10_big_fil_rev_8_21_14_0_10_36_32]
MPKDLTKENVNPGDIAFQWIFKEYEKYSRGRGWYVVMILLVAALIIYAIVSNNYLFALIVVLFGIILFLQDMQEPAQMDFAITDSGVVLGTKYYPYSDLENFWIIYNPPETKTLYFKLKSVIKHRLTIPLADINPVEAREYLKQFLMEDLAQEEEPLSDRISRLFKIQ